MNFVDINTKHFAGINFENAFSIVVIVINIFIITSKLHNGAELTELHKRTLVTSFLRLLIGKVNMGRLK